MSNTPDVNVNTNAFWLMHGDTTQSAVHLALNWLAYVYPESEAQLEPTLSQALSSPNQELSEQWRDFLETGRVEEHVEALEWLSNSLSPEETPFLMETGWRLLLADHTMPNQVPLALRLLARILKLPEYQVYAIGERIWQDEQDLGDTGGDERPVLLPDDPRYLDRIEWRLYGGSGQESQGREADVTHSRVTTWAWHHGLSYFAGLISGVSILAFMVWGPLELGVQRVPPLRTSVEEMPPPPAGDSASAELDAAIADLLGDMPQLADEFERQEPASEQYSELLEQALRDLEPPTEAGLPGLAESTEVEESIDASNSIVAVGREDDSGVDLEVPLLPEPEVPVDTMDSEVEMRVTASVLNVRERATVNSVVVMQLSEGQRVWVNPERREGDWENVRLDDLEGYASGQFLEPVEAE